MNMRPTWICSRNDLMANVGLLVAAALAALTGGFWPDLAVGVAIAGLFLYSAIGVLGDARTHFLQSVAPADRAGRRR